MTLFHRLFMGHKKVDSCSVVHHLCHSSPPIYPPPPKWEVANFPKMGNNQFLEIRRFKEINISYKFSKIFNFFSFSPSFYYYYYYYIFQGSIIIIIKIVFLKLFFNIQFIMDFFLFCILVFSLSPFQ